MLNKFEEIALEFIRREYDPDAYGIGGFNSAKPDIISPKFGCNIEAKYYLAQAGQFTESTIDKNPYSRKIAEIQREDVPAELCAVWCKEHYRQKDVGYFVIVNKDESCDFYTIDEFFDNYEILLETRPSKKSGSAPLARKYYDQIPVELYSLTEVIDLPHNGKTVKFCTNTDLWNYKYSFDVIFSDGTIRHAGVNANGMLYVKSMTQNETWIFKLGKKKA